MSLGPERATGGWRVKIVPRTRKDETPSADLDARELGWLRAIVELPDKRFLTDDGNSFHYALALRAAGDEPVGAAAKPGDARLAGRARGVILARRPRRCRRVVATGEQHRRVDPLHAPMIAQRAFTRS